MQHRSRVRPYRAADREACRELWRQLTQWHRDIYDAPHIGGEHPEEQFDEHLATVGAESLWVAVDGDVLVGLVGLIVGDGEAEVEPIVVAAESRARGVGSALMRRVETEARNRGITRLTVRPVARNDRALAFFQHHGFTVLGQVELMRDLDPPQTRRWWSDTDIAGIRFER